MLRNISKTIEIILILFLCSCSSSAQLPLPNEQPLIQDPEFEPEHIKFTTQELLTNNCDGNSSKTTISKSILQEQSSFFQVEVEAGGIVRGTPIPAFLQAEIETKITGILQSQGGLKNGSETSFEIITPPGKALKHSIEWKETKVKGVIPLVFKDGTAKISFDKTIGIELNGRNSVEIACNNPKSTELSTNVTITPSTLTATQSPNQNTNSGAYVQEVPATQEEAAQEEVVKKYLASVKKCQ